MGRIRGWLRSLERRSEQEMVAIPQMDGSVKRFPQSALKEAFMNCMERLGAGDDAPPLHPLVEAAANSSDPRWRESYFGDIDFPGSTEPIEDRSEGQD